MAEYEPSPAERKANAEKALAEAQRFLAEARKLNAEAEKAEAEALTAKLSATKTLADDISRQAGDEYHHVYRFLGEVNNQTVGACIKKLTEWHRIDPGCDIEVIFFSPGGEVFAGLALFDFLVQLGRDGHQVTTGCTGMAASMAGILLQAGQVRWMSKESWVLIHRLSFATWGKTYEVEDEAEWASRIEKRIIDIFTSRSKLTPQKIRAKWNRKDWWITSDEAKEYGLVDEVRSELLSEVKFTKKKRG